MLSPDDIIGQKVWLTVPRNPDFPDLDPYRVKAEVIQPTSPPWFFARYLDPPPTLPGMGQWLSLYEAQQVVLMDPVLEDYDWDDDDWDDEFSRDQFELS